MTLQADIAIQTLTAAAQSTLGIRVRIDAVSPNVIQPTSRAKQLLYQHKTDNSDFKHLIIKFDPIDPEHYLWIYPGEMKED
jgi:hypothetical protein